MRSQVIIVTLTIQGYCAIISIATGMHDEVFVSKDYGDNLFSEDHAENTFSEEQHHHLHHRKFTELRVNEQQRGRLLCTSMWSSGLKSFLGSFLEIAYGGTQTHSSYF